jgi:hypothetical protein
MGTITIGIDLAKLLFSRCSMDEGGHVLQRRELRREAFIAWLAQLAPGTVSPWKRVPVPITGRGGVWNWGWCHG